MTTGRGMHEVPRQRLSEALRRYHEDLIMQRFVAAVESCLFDLGVAPSVDEFRQLRLLCSELAKSPAVSRGVQNLCRDLGATLYRRSQGPGFTDEETGPTAAATEKLRGAGHP